MWEALYVLKEAVFRTSDQVTAKQIVCMTILRRCQVHTQCHIYHLEKWIIIVIQFLFFIDGALNVVCPYFAGTEVLNGSFNGTTPEKCGGGTVTAF